MIVDKDDISLYDNIILPINNDIYYLNTITPDYIILNLEAIINDFNRKLYFYKNLDETLLDMHHGFIHNLVSVEKRYKIKNDEIAILLNGLLKFLLRLHYLIKDLINNESFYIREGDINNLTVVGWVNEQCPIFSIVTDEVVYSTSYQDFYITLRN